MYDLLNWDQRIPASSCRYLSESLYDITGVLKQSTPTTPVLMMFSKERETAERLFTGFATKKQIPTLVVSLSGRGPGEEKVVKKNLQQGMAEVSWCAWRHCDGSVQDCGICM